MFPSFGCHGDRAAGTARPAGNRVAEDHVAGTSPTPGLPDSSCFPSRCSPACRLSQPSGTPNYRGEGGLCRPPRGGGGFNFSTATAAAVGSDSESQPGFPATQQPQQPQSATHLQLPLNPQLASLTWDGCQPPLLQLPQPQQPGPPRLRQLQSQQQEQQRPRSQVEPQPLAHFGAPAQTGPAGPLGAGPCHGAAAFYRRPSSLSRADAVLSVRQDEHVLDEQSGVDRLLNEIRSALWPAPDPRFGTNALISTWQHSAPAAAATAAAAPAGGPAAAPPPLWPPRGTPQATRVEQLAWAGGGSTGHGTAGLVPVTTAAASHSAALVLSASSVDAGLVAGVAPSTHHLGPASLLTASAASDTMGSPCVTLAGLWAQEGSATRQSCPQLHAMGLMGSSSLHSAPTFVAGFAPMGLLRLRSWNLPPRIDTADAVSAIVSASAVLGPAQSKAPPHAPLALPTACALPQPPLQPMVVLPSGGVEPLGGCQPFAPAGSALASVMAIDVEQLFGGAGALAPQAAALGPSGGSDGWHVGGIPPAGTTPGAGGGGGTGHLVQLGRQSMLSDSTDMSFSGAEVADEAGDAFLDFSDADFGFAGMDSGGSGAGGGAGDGGGSGAGGGAGDGGGSGGGGGRSLTLDDLRPLFDRQVGEVVRLLRVGVNDFNRRCRALGVCRWPQRKLLSLCKLEEAVRGDSGLSEERRQVLLTSITRNREAILEAPGTDLEPGLKLRRQLHYKRHFVSRQAADGGGRGGGGGGRSTAGPAAAAATTAGAPSSPQRLTWGVLFAPVGSPLDAAAAAPASASAPISASSLAAWSELPDVAVPDALRSWGGQL